MTGMQRTLRLVPCWFMIPNFSGVLRFFWASGSSRGNIGSPNYITDHEDLQQEAREKSLGEGTFVMSTSSPRGRFSFLIALPRIRSERPEEYAYASELSQSQNPAPLSQSEPHVGCVERLDSVLVSAAAKKLVIMRRTLRRKGTHAA